MVRFENGRWSSPKNLNPEKWKLNACPTNAAAAAAQGDRVAIAWYTGAQNSPRVRRISAAGAAGPVIQVAQGSRKSLGYPRILQAGNETWVAWANSATAAKVQTARLLK